MKTSPSLAPLEVTAAELEAALAHLRRRLAPELVAALAQGDFAQNLLAHFRQRSRPRLCFSLDRLPQIAQLARAHDPQEFAWEKRIADEAMAGRSYAASNAYCDRFVELPADFNFSRFEHFDPQAIHGLNRLRWLVCLARQYWLEQDPACFHALMQHWDYFCARVPAPDQDLFQRVHRHEQPAWAAPYSELDTYIRLMNWWWAYWLSVPAPLLSPQRHAVLLHRCLQQFDFVAMRGCKNLKHNFTAMQMEALYFWSMSLPEIQGMDLWKHTARNCQASSLRQAVWPDGVQWEMSAGYHAGCIRWYAAPFLLGQRNDEPWADDYGESLRKMGHFLDAIITPDGNEPLISDSDRCPGWQGPQSLLRCAFPDFRFQHPVGPTLLSLWLSDGQMWPADLPASAPVIEVFPQGGIAAIRPDRDSLLLLDNGPSDAGHAHDDNLTIHWDTLGQPVIVDPGRWIYEQGPKRHWVLSCRAHNTLCIEDSPEDDAAARHFYRLGSTSDGRLGPIDAAQQGPLVRLSTTCAAWRSDRSAQIHRQLVLCSQADNLFLAVIDRITCPNEHNWVNSFLLPASDPVAFTGPLGRLTLESGLRLLVQYAAGDQLARQDEKKFWCPQYAQARDARWLRFSSRCQSGLRAFLFQVHAAGGSAIAPGALSIAGEKVLIQAGAQSVTIAG